jgi:glycosyltransferase involved in cell wall biosynthesis
MRILVLSHEYPPVGGGAGASCSLLSEQYAAAGHEVVALTMGWERLPCDEQINGVHVLRQPCGRKRWEMASPWEGLKWAQRACRVAAQLHRKSAFDVVHAHFIMPGGIVARWLKRVFKLPYVITPRGSDVPGYNRERLKLAHLLARPWWKQIVRDANQILSPSHSLLQLIQAEVPDVRATVIPNGVNTVRFQPGNKERRILLCSRLVERKGFQYFLEGIRDLNLPGWQVDLVGSGPYQETLLQLAAVCRTPVTLHGRIENRDPRLAELYARASIFVMPSEQENCPVSILEGMTAGCAVITANVTGNPEVVGDTGYLVPARDPEALRNAVLELTADESRCRTLGQAARNRILTTFEPALIAARNLAVLNACLPNPEVSL